MTLCRGTVVKCWKPWCSCAWQVEVLDACWLLSGSERIYSIGVAQSEYVLAKGSIALLLLRHPFGIQHRLPEIVTASCVQAL